MVFPFLVALAVGSPDRADPRGLIPAAPPVAAGTGAACGDLPARPLTLPDLVDIALCRNPRTGAAWANVRAAAAGIGIARAAELPTVNASIGPNLSRSDSLRNTGFVDSNGNFIGGSSSLTQVNSTARLAVSWLVFDGGGRRAQIDRARAQQEAALADYADTAQAIVIDVVTAYNSLAANRAVEDANLANLVFARQSRDLAAGRATAGVATGADRLQAETSLAQAEVTLVQTRGNVATAAAQLAVAAGLRPTVAFDLAPAAPLGSGDMLARGADALIADAERLRPDIVSARAQVTAADAAIAQARSLGRPSLQASASNNLSAIDTNLDRNSGSIGLSLSVPLFSGWNTRYQIAQARAQRDGQAAQAENIRQQAGLAVYSQYVALQTSLAALTGTRALIASATAAADLAQGRYRAGVGTFADLLNAQSALASARQQLVQAEFNVRTSRAQLARAVGDIGEAIGDDGNAMGKGRQ